MTHPKTAQLALIKASFELCQRHADLLQIAMQHLIPLIPIKPTMFTQMSEENLAFCDQFGTRFCKLQDMMGTKVFPQILELTYESGSFNTFIDKLNQLEKIGAIASAEQWITLREIRNRFSHEYPLTSEIHAENFNQAFSAAHTLLEIFKDIQKFVEKVRISVQ